MRMRVGWLGRRPYEEVLELQHRLVEQVASGAEPDTLLLLEHESVLTCGRGTDLTHLRDASGLPVFEGERGGDVTWHGPGQLVGYPILRLEEEERDLHLHLRRIEDLLIGACRDLGCPAGRREGFTGVWTPAEDPQRKVASIGVAVRRWTTFHGFALNVAVPPDAFASIAPCGLDASVMSSLAVELGSPVLLPDLIASLHTRIAAVFGRTPAMERPPTGLLQRP